MDNETTTHIAMAQQAQKMREKMDQMAVAGISSAAQGNSLIHQGTTVSGIWNTDKLASIYRSNKDTELTIREVENGRVVLLGSKTYIVAPGQPLLEVISQALVEAQLEK